MFDKNVWFTADLHWDSANVIGYCDRPYSTVAEMNEILIDNYNSRVKKQEHVFILGDLAWSGTEEYLLSKLNGQKHLILGNHDRKGVYIQLAKKGLLQDINQMRGVTVDNQYIWMCHYPMRSWNKSFYGSWCIYGHVHNRLPDYGFSTDVGVDCWNYYPVSYEELKDKFKGRDILYNQEVKNDYELFNTNFIKHFTTKYKEKNSREADYLYNLL
jgi:calcineurin-like phosphoesterase family protein